MTLRTCQTVRARSGRGPRVPPSTATGKWLGTSRSSERAAGVQESGARVQSYSWSGTLTGMVPVGITTAGLRLDASFEGQMGKGAFEGSSIRGIDYLLLRRDSVAVVDAREQLVLPSGLAVALHARGYITPPFELPPLEALLTPDFSWPDVEMPMHGCVLAEGGGDDAAEWNRVVFGFRGGVNVGAGTLHVEAASLPQ